MALHQIEHPDAYIRYLQKTPVELDGLFRDLLIGVTNFFVTRRPSAPFRHWLSRIYLPESPQAERFAFGCAVVPPARRSIPSPS